MRTSEFKKQVESIQYSDVLALRKAKETHALKLEDLEIRLEVANEYVEVMRDFLSELGFSDERIDSFECRHRDGYSPYSHNKGGIEGIAYRGQTDCCQNTGFENTDEVLERNSNYLLETFAKENGLDVSKYDGWTDEQLNNWWEYERSDEDTVQFQARIMFTSETTANVDLYVSASDSPYHRRSDDKLEIEIEFKSVNGLKQKLNRLKKNAFVARLAKNVREGL
jgi:hypothetical protein